MLLWYCFVPHFVFLLWQATLVFFYSEIYFHLRINVFVEVAGVAQLAECLCSMRKALDLIPTTA